MRFITSCRDICCQSAALFKPLTWLAGVDVVTGPGHGHILRSAPPCVVRGAVANLSIEFGRRDVGLEDPVSAPAYGVHGAIQSADLSVRILVVDHAPGQDRQRRRQRETKLAVVPSCNQISPSSSLSKEQV